GAARIGGGELGHRIDVRTKDELQELGEQFNRMAGALQESYATLEQKVEDRTRALTESLEQQTATAEILRVISSSPTDERPVFEAILAAAVRLCGARLGGVFRFDGELIHFVTAHEWPEEHQAVVRQHFPMPPGDGSLVARSIRDRRVVQTADYAEDSTLPQWAIENERFRLGARSTVALPMLREGHPLGGIVLARTEPGLFSDTHIALLQTFADQAVIAIENVRLFKELESRNAALTESLDQQTATAEILSVISSSPTNVKPVLDAVAEAAARLCGANDAIIRRIDGEDLVLAAHYGSMPVAEAALRLRLSHGTAAGRAVLEGQTIQIEDLSDPRILAEYPDLTLGPTRTRTTLFAPLMREGIGVGLIVIRRMEVQPFTDKQVELLQTFADQAVIAIENVRLFKELETRNAALTESLDQQTATSDILGVISSSPTDVAPVFGTILGSATRLCDASFAVLFLYDGEALKVAAHQNASPKLIRHYESGTRVTPSMEGPARRAALLRETVHITDMTKEPGLVPIVLREEDVRTVLAVPLLREGALAGVIAMWRREVRPFTDKQIALVRTFADQAVIAIENVRLFTELQARTGELTRSVEELKALGEVGRALSSTLDVPTVLDTILTRANVLAGTDGGAIYEFATEDRRFHLRRAADTFDEGFVALLRANPIALGEGVVGRSGELREPVQIPDIRDPGMPYDSSVREAVLAAGYRALLAVPLLSEDEVVGALVVNRRTPGEFEPRIVDVLRTFGTQSALAIQNARLFREIEDKSRQLEAANRHKDEFLASMSHELRTPLNAVIGFSEVLLEKMFGEVNAKQEEYLNDILASGRHLLSLINDILDLAKIEAGRMELDVEAFDVAQAVDNAVVLVRERATRKGLTLLTTLDKNLGEIRGDQRKIKQVLLNLLSNAVKFTPEGGQIEVRAQRMPDHVEIAVIDSGIGIAAEDLEAVFEEFRQVGTDYAKKHEGTGLGLTLSRKFVELHGGRIWVKSALGQGSTFAFSLPGGPWPAS
ncbi:MAG TPA: GAF domain-containing protein, partial [Methylomirabilota bacterium]|nr:GAF domain-containing protein [Methylomirabilota bacterium]